ncbi:tRNA (5-methylaminomethyl-2-thiouridine)(34)-methyltransferase MnmD [Propionivibrio limicola]|uniref:tRNA (5-methylaminomethyl-2-thiouridine)(34)-methyltransferase MnmD n=1 Tax=Propionivibrio limicola TaxID=167645 RepID=UPI001290C355
MPIEPARLLLAPDGTPFSETYGDVYHSVAGGHAQAQHVFLAGNGLPERWQGRETFSILETGFGLGLNFMATWLAWKNDAARCRGLEFVSVEKHPFSVDDLRVAHSVWPEFAELVAHLHEQWPRLVAGEHRLVLEEGHVTLRLVFGDAVAVLPTLEASVDAFYLDGFSPAKNPDLWSGELFRSLTRLANPGATLATWSVAGHVRQALQAAGFAIEKRQGFAGKRQMLVGMKAEEPFL